MANQAPTGMSALASVLLVAQQSKMDFEEKNPGLKAVEQSEEKVKLPKLARRLQRHMKQRLNELSLDHGLRQILKDHKYELLENLVEEQNYRIKLIASDEKANLE